MSYLRIDIGLGSYVAINILSKVGQGMPELTPVDLFVGTSVKQDVSDL